MPNSPENTPGPQNVGSSPSEESFRALFNSVPVGLYRTLPDGRHLDANRTYLEMLGVESLEALRDWNVELGYVQPNNRDAWVQELKTHGYVRREVEWRRPDGKVFWVDERAQVCRDADGTVYFDGSALDITERKRAEQEREHLQERLRHAEKLESIGTLAGGVAHDFRNQLTVILMYAKALEGTLATQKENDAIDRIVQACGQAGDLTQKLLTFARKGSALYAPVLVHPVLQDVVVLATSLDRRVLVQAQLHAERDLVLGDAHELQNAFLNLAINARDAMPHGGTLTFSTRVVVRTQGSEPDLPEEMPPGAYLGIWVQDSGSGIGAETLAHIFEPFFTTKAEGKGTGLGLASVYGTVKRLNGFIGVVSTPGQGACFQIQLPLYQPDMEG